MRFIVPIFLCLCFLGGPVSAVQVVSESPYAFCEEFQFKKSLPVYKDPSLFMATLNQIYLDPEVGWKALLQENPLLTTVKGRVHLMRLGPARAFKNFGEVSRIYELADRRFAARPARETLRGEEQGEKAKRKSPAFIVPVMFCGVDDSYSAYANTLAFVVEEDLNRAQSDEGEIEQQLPPSTYPNPIPTYRPQKN